MHEYSNVMNLGVFVPLVNQMLVSLPERWTRAPDSYPDVVFYLKFA